MSDSKSDATGQTVPPTTSQGDNVTGVGLTPTPRTGANRGAVGGGASQAPPPGASMATAMVVDDDAEEDLGTGTASAVRSLAKQFGTVSVAASSESDGGPAGDDLAKTTVTNPRALETPGPVPTPIAKLFSESARSTRHPRVMGKRTTAPFLSASSPTHRLRSRDHHESGESIAESDTENPVMGTGPRLRGIQKRGTPNERVRVEQDDKNVVVHVSGEAHGKIPRLPSYGGTATEDLDSWIDRVYTTQAFKRWSDSDAFDNAVLHLIGDAWNEYRVNKGVITRSVDALADMLRKRFQPVDYGRQCLQKFLGIKQSSSENAPTYEARFRGALLKVDDAGLPESTVLELFINSLRPSYRAELERARPASLTDAFDAFRRAERIISSGTSTVNFVGDTQQTHRTNTPAVQETMEKILETLQRRHVAPASGSVDLNRNGPRCFLCDSLLHKMRDCPHNNRNRTGPAMSAGPRFTNSRSPRQNNWNSRGQNRYQPRQRFQNNYSREQTDVCSSDLLVPRCAITRLGQTSSVNFRGNDHT